MPLSADQRQQIILEMQARGMDAASLVAHAIDDINAAIAENVDAYENQGQAADRTVQKFERLTAALTKLLQLQQEAARQNEEFAQSMQKVDVGWAKLVVDSLKFADSVRASVISIGQLQDSAQKLKSDRIKEFHDNTERLTRAFEAAVISVDQLGVSAARLKSDRIDQFYVNTKKMSDQFEASVIATDQLAASATKLKSDRIEEAANAADRLRESFRRAGKSASDADQLIRSMSPRQLIELADATDRAAQRSTRFAYAFSAVAHASQDFAQSGFAATINNIPLMTQYAIQASPALENLANKFGGAAAVAGGFMIAGLGIEQLLRSEAVQRGLRDWARGFDLVRDPIRDATSSLEGLKEQEQAIRDRPLLFDADRRAARDLGREIDEATRALQELDALNRRRTEKGEASHRMVAEAVADAGGGGGRFEAAMAEIARRDGTFGAGSEEMATVNRLNAEVEEARRVIQALGSGTAAVRAATARTIANLRQIEQLQPKVEAIGRQQIADMLALKRGDASRRTLEDIANDPRNQAVFEAHGIDAMRLSGGFGAAADPFAADRRKHEADLAKKEADALKEKNRLEKEAQDNADRARKKKQDQAEAAGVEQIRINDRLNREKARADARARRQADADEKAAPARERRQRVASYAQEFQARAGAEGLAVTGQQAERVGGEIEAAVSRGVDANDAMARAFNRLVRIVTQSNANQEAMMGVVGGPWQQQLMMLEQQNAMNAARVRMLGAQARRMGTRTVTNNLTPGS